MTLMPPRTYFQTSQLFLRQYRLTDLPLVSICAGFAFCAVFTPMTESARALREFGRSDQV